MWASSYVIAKQIGYAQVLQALSQLAPQLGLPEGLAGWENLAQRVQNGEKIEFGQEESEVEQIRGFVRGLVHAMREKSPDAEKYFQSVSKMAIDPQAPSHVQELGKVLQRLMSGIKNPDLSALTEEIRKIVEEEIGGKDEG